MPMVENPPLVVFAALALASAVFFYLRRWRLTNTEAKALSVSEDHEKRRRLEDWASKLFQALDQNPATIFITDADGRFVYVNDSFTQTTGYARDAVLGQPMTLQSPSSDAAAPYAAMWAAARRGEVWKGEVQTRRCDGALFWERVLFSPLKDRDGHVTHFVAIKEDISELRSVLSRLQESEGRFRAATAAMVEALVVIGADGRILFANPAAEAFMACPPGGLVGVRATDVSIDRLREDGTPYAPEDYPLTRS